MEDFEIECTCSNCKHGDDVWFDDPITDEEPCYDCDNYSNFELADGFCVNCVDANTDYDKPPCSECSEIGNGDVSQWRVKE